MFEEDSKGVIKSRKLKKNLTKAKKKKTNIGQQNTTVKPVYKGHSWEPDNMAFMSSCPLYTY